MMEEKIKEETIEVYLGPFKGIVKLTPEEAEKELKVTQSWGALNVHIQDTIGSDEKVGG